MGCHNRTASLIMDYADTKKKYIQAWFQEMALELSSAGISLTIPPSLDGFWKIKGTFQGGDVIFYITRTLDTLKINWGPYYIPQSRVKFVTSIQVGGRTYKTLTSKLIRAVRKLPPGTLRGTAAMEAIIIQACQPNAQPYWTLERLLSSISDADVGCTLHYDFWTFKVSQALKDVVRREDTQAARDLIANYPI